MALTGPDDLTDSYVIDLMKKDAARLRDRPMSTQQRPLISGALRPNTDFLRNLVRSTDSHNAALLAKERRDAQARQDILERKYDGRLSPPINGSKNASICVKVRDLKWPHRNEDAPSKAAVEPNDASSSERGNGTRNGNRNPQVEHLGELEKADKDEHRASRKRHRSRSPCRSYPYEVNVDPDKHGRSRKRHRSRSTTRRRKHREEEGDPFLLKQRKKSKGKRQRASPERNLRPPVEIDTAEPETYKPSSRRHRSRSPKKSKHRTGVDTDDTDKHVDAKTSHRTPSITKSRKHRIEKNEDSLGRARTSRTKDLDRSPMSGHKHHEKEYKTERKRHNTSSKSRHRSQSPLNRVEHDDEEDSGSPRKGDKLPSEKRHRRRSTTNKRKQDAEEHGTLVTVDRRETQDRSTVKGVSKHKRAKPEEQRGDTQLKLRNDKAHMAEARDENQKSHVEEEKGETPEQRRDRRRAKEEDRSRIGKRRQRSSTLVKEAEAKSRNVFDHEAAKNSSKRSKKHRIQGPAKLEDRTFVRTELDSTLSDDLNKDSKKKSSRSAVDDNDDNDDGFTHDHARVTKTKHKKHKKRSKNTPSPNAHEGSDPLQSIIGPSIPPQPPQVQTRGRGTFTTNKTVMDSHFSSTYDPTAEAQSLSGNEDDWDQALEAMRDRQKWQQAGADRLRAAGFTEEQVSKWEKKGKSADGDVDDLRWKHRGAGREWDRGKVVKLDDEDGGLDVEVRADWSSFGRLKGT